MAVRTGHFLTSPRCEKRTSHAPRFNPKTQQKIKTAAKTVVKFRVPNLKDGKARGEVSFATHCGGVGGEGSPKGQRDRGGIGSRPKSATKLRALHAAGNKFFHQSLKLFTGARDDHFAGFRPASCPPFFAYLISSIPIFSQIAISSGRCG